MCAEFNEEKDAQMNLTILTYNINKFRNWLFKEISRNALKDLILSVNADIIFLQEFSGENRKRKKIIHELEGFIDNIWSDFAYGKNSIYEGGHHGNVILSKYPIVHWENINISTNFLEKRGLLHARISIPFLQNNILQHNKEIDLYCLHLNPLQKGRSKQIREIIKIVSEKKLGTPFIIAGDLNDWNFKLDKIIAKDLNVIESTLQISGAHTKTFPSFSPHLCLDRIYTRGLIPLEILKYPLDGSHLLSDHLPLAIKVSLNE